MPRRGAGQRRLAPHVRVITQAGARALRLGNPGLALAFDHAQAHQFASFLGQAIQHRLHDIRAAARQVAKAHGNQPGR
ncbi:hypothetical protein D3C85_529450 [compost metagenome]